MIRQGAELYVTEVLEVLQDPTADPALVEVVLTDVAAFAELVRGHVERLSAARDEESQAESGLALNLSRPGIAGGLVPRHGCAE